jgi:hypothetical protein
VLAVAALLGASAAALTQPAPADREVPEKKEPASRPVAEKKEGVSENTVVSGVVKAVEADRNALTVAGKDGEKVYTAAPGATVVINGKPGSLAGLRPGARVALSRFVDPQTARNLEAAGPQVSGAVKAVDADRNTLAVVDREGESTFAVGKNAQVEIDGKPGKLAAVPPGALVTLSWFVDVKTARIVQAAGPWWQDVLVKAVDADKNTLTFGEGERQPAEVAGKTFPLAPGAIVVIDGKPAKLAALPPGSFVLVHLSADQKRVGSLDATGPGVQNVLVKAVDAGKSTITFDEKQNDRQAAELIGKTLPVSGDALITIDDKPARVAGVPPGTFIDVGLSMDRKTIRVVHARGPGFQDVVVKAVDAEKNTITFEDDRLNDKQPAELAGKTFTLAKGAAVAIDGKPGKLAALPPGAFVNLGLCVDQKAIRSVEARGPAFQNVLVKAVDADRNTITLGDYPQQPADLVDKTLPVARDAFLWIDEQPGKLAGVPPGTFLLGLVLSVDQKTVRGITARGPEFQNVLVTAVDAEKNTITVDMNGEGEKTFAVARDAKIEIDGKAGKLAGLPKEATVTLALSVDRKTVRWVQAKGS